MNKKSKVNKPEMINDKDMSVLNKKLPGSTAAIILTFNESKKSALNIIFGNVKNLEAIIANAIVSDPKFGSLLMSSIFKARMFSEYKKQKKGKK